MLYGRMVCYIMNKRVIGFRVCMFLSIGIMLFSVLQSILNPSRYGTMEYYDETTRQLEGFYDEKIIQLMLSS